MGIINNLVGRLGGALGLGLAPGSEDQVRNLMAEDEAAKRAAIRGFAGMKKGGKVGSASKRADGIAQRGKTRGKMY